MPKVMKKALRPLPKFKSEDEERAFWAANDATEYVNWRPARRVKLPKLKPTKPVK